MSIRLAFLPLILLLLSLDVNGQDVVFSATADAREVSIGGYLEVTFAVRNGNGKNLVAPDFNGFNILGGPNRASSTSIVNGSISQSSSFTYVLEPTRTGTLTIGPATVEVGRKKYHSAPLTINVVAEDQTSSIDDQIRNAGDVFVRLEISHSTAYPGQQVILDYIVYTRTNISSFNFNSLPDFTGIFVKDFENYDAGPKRRLINGQNYTTKVLKRQALYPQQTGKIEITPAVITLGIPFENNSPFGSLFSSSKPKQVKTNALQLEVIPFPTPSPTGFTGTAGQFNYTASVDKNQLTTDDAVMIHFTIKGNGDMKRVQPPVMTFDSMFTVYPPELLEDTETEAPRSFNGSRTYVVDMTPKHPGEFTLDLPSFTYFDTDQKTFKTIHTDPIVIQVTQGNELPMAQQDAPYEPPPVPQPTFIQQYSSVIYGGLGALALLSILVLVRRNKHVKETKKSADKTGAPEEIPPSTNVSRNYYKPYNELLAIETLKQEGDWSGVFSQLNEVISRFLSDKFEVPFSAYSIPYIIETMAEKGVPVAQYEEVRQLLQRLEMATYARQYQINRVDEDIELVKKLIREL